MRDLSRLGIRAIGSSTQEAGHSVSCFHKSLPLRLESRRCQSTFREIAIRQDCQPLPGDYNPWLGLLRILQGKETLQHPRCYRFYGFRYCLCKGPHFL